jgi:hypothetical protein
LSVIIRMLNPFAIEKELLSKTASLSTLLRVLKGVVAVSVVERQESGQAYSPAIVEQCLEMKENIEQGSKQYVCKTCGKEFDEGRKLGGHVSRAHKGASQCSLSIESEESVSETYHPRCSKRRRTIVEDYGESEEESETGIKKVKLPEAIYEE